MNITAKGYFVTFPLDGLFIKVRENERRILGKKEVENALRGCATISYIYVFFFTSDTNANI